jgi:hypothetical protein
LSRFPQQHPFDQEYCIPGIFPGGFGLRGGSGGS